VEFTLTVSTLPIQFAKAQLCIADDIIAPVSVNPTIPRILEANAESYIVRYEPTYHQFLKGSIISSDRENKEYKAHLRLTIEGKEEDFPEITFSFESSRPQ